MTDMTSESEDAERQLREDIRERLITATGGLSLSDSEIDAIIRRVREADKG